MITQRQHTHKIFSFSPFCDGTPDISSLDLTPIIQEFFVFVNNLQARISIITLAQISKVLNFEYILKTGIISYYCVQVMCSACHKIINSLVHICEEIKWLCVAT